MPKRTVWILIGITLIAVVPALALARGGAKNHAVSLTTQFDTITSTSSTGTPGDRDRDAGIVTGTIDGKSFGTGALVQTVKWGANLSSSGSGTTFAKNGTVSYRFTGKLTPAAGGKLNISATFTVTGGTGVYKNASGKVTGTGSAPLGSDTDAGQVRVTGKIKY